MIGNVIFSTIRERGVNDMKAKIVRSLLLVATVLSVGVSSVPVMAVDLSPDTDTDSGISVDADDSKIPMSESLFTYHSVTPKSPMPVSHMGLYFLVQDD